MAMNDGKKQNTDGKDRGDQEGLKSGKSAEQDREKVQSLRRISEQDCKGNEWNNAHSFSAKNCHSRTEGVCESGSVDCSPQTYGEDR